MPPAAIDRDERFCDFVKNDWKREKIEMMILVYELNKGEENKKETCIYRLGNGLGPKLAFRRLQGNAGETAQQKILAALSISEFQLGGYAVG